MSFLQVDKILYLFGLMLFLSTSAYTQNFKIAELERELSFVKEDKSKVDVFNELADEYWHNDLDIGIKYATEAFQLATKIDYQSGIAMSLANQGIGLIYRGELEEAQFNLQTSEKIFQKLNDSINLAFVWNQLGSIYLYKSDYNKAHIFFEKQRTIGIRDQETAKIHIRSLRRQTEIFMEQGNIFKAGEFIDRYMKLAEKANLDSIQIIESLIQKVKFLIQTSKRDEARGILNNLISLTETVQDRLISMSVYLQFGLLELAEANFEEAFSYFQTGLAMATQFDDRLMKSQFLAAIASIYLELSNYFKASEFYLQSLQEVENSQYIFQISNQQLNIGISYYFQKSYSEADVYIERSLAGFSKIENQNGIAWALNHRGLSHYHKKDYKKAEKDHREALEIRKSLGNTAGKAASYYNLAICLEHLGKTEEALEYHFESLGLEEELKNYRGLVISYNGLGRFYTRIGKFGQALEYLKNAESLIEEKGYKNELRETYLFYADLYDSIGDKSLALDYLRLYQTKADSIFSDNLSRQIAQQQALVDLEEKNKEILLLNKDNDIINAQLELERNKVSQQKVKTGLTGLLLVFLFIIIVVLVMLGKAKSKSNEELKTLFREISEQKEEIEVQSEELREANDLIVAMNEQLEAKVIEKSQKLIKAYDELDTFFYRSSHDFRRPLTTLQGLANVAKITVSDATALDLFSKVNEISLALDKMLVKFQTISLLGHEDMPEEIILWEEMINHILLPFDQALKSNIINVSIQVSANRDFISFPDLVKVMLENLMENSIQFAKQQGFINISVEDDRSGILIKVSDNGDGIDPSYHERIFDMYVRANERAKGNGLGLFIVKKIIEKLNGMVHVQSEYGKGAIFTIYLPHTS